MYSMEKLKELAVRQMRAAANLYEECNHAENELTEESDEYSVFYLRCLYSCRKNWLERNLDLTPAKEEDELWKSIIE